MKKNNDTILFLLHLPPPIHGSSVVGEQIFSSKLINDSFNCKYINLLLSDKLNNTGKISFRKALKFISIWFKLLFVLLFNKPKLVYFALTATGVAFYKDFLLIALIKIFGVKIVYHLHNKGFSSKSSKLYESIYKIVFSNAKVIILSELLAVDINKYVKKKNIFVCPNGIDDNRQKNQESKIKTYNKIPNILFLSNLIESKGVYILLEACKQLNTMNINFSCSFIGGEGDITAIQLNKKIQELGLENKVKYLGKKYGNEKNDFFTKADIFVFPTYYHNETFGLVNLEAMQFSLPIVSTNEGGIPDIVVNGVNGFIVAKRNVEALVDKLKYLIENPEIAIEFGKVGRSLYENKYTYKIFEKKIYEILNEVQREYSSKINQRIKKTKILFLSPLPPPFYGSAMSSEMCLEILNSNDNIDIRKIKLNYSLKINDLEKLSFRKVWGFIRVTLLIVYYQITFKQDITYFMPATYGVASLRDIVFILLTRLNSSTKVFHIRTIIPDLKNNSLKNKIFKFVFKGGIAIILGDELRINISKYFESNRIHVLPNAIIPTISDEQFEIIKICRNNNNNNLNLIFISNMLKAKGWFIALVAAKILHNQGINFNFTFAGAWSSENDKIEFFNYVKENNLTNIIKHLGFINQKEKNKLLCESDILIFPTFYKYETFGRVIIEAMEYGIPVIANGIASINSLIDNNKTGYILKNNLPQEIAENVIKLQNQALREEFGNLSRQKFLEKYTYEIYRRNFNQLILKCK